MSWKELVVGCLCQCSCVCEQDAIVWCRECPLFFSSVTTYCVQCVSMFFREKQETLHSAMYLLSVVRVISECKRDTELLYNYSIYILDF